MGNKKKELLNIVDIFDEFVDRLNTQSEQAKTGKVYDITFTKGKTPLVNKDYTGKKGEKPQHHDYETMKVYVADVKTGERTVVYENNYVFNNPAERLTSDYKRKFMVDFMYTMYVFFNVNMENVIKIANINKNVDNKDLFKQGINTGVEVSPEGTVKERGMHIVKEEKVFDPTKQ